MLPEALVIDNEVSGYIMRFQRGFDLTDETLGLVTAKSVGLTGSPLDTEYATRHYRKELSCSKLAVRARPAHWEADSCKTLEESARHPVRTILAGEV
jgi:trimethylamine:corrinoid methyltransferase-like protein